MPKKKKYKFPVKAITIKGKVLTIVLKVVYQIFDVFTLFKRGKPKKNFEENPRYMSIKDCIYLGYKYYHNPHTVENCDMSDYFKNQKINFEEKSFIQNEGLSLSIGGDLMPYKTLTKKNCQNLWNDIGDFYFGGDIVFANLETPISSTIEPKFSPELILGDVVFNASEELFHVFNGLGIYRGLDIVSTANNHSLDAGIKGLLETMEHLNRKNIKYCGSFHDKSIKNRYTVIEKNGIKIAFIGYTYSLNQYELDQENSWLVNHARLNKDFDISEIKKQVLKAKGNGADIVVLSVHMGNAYQTIPSKHIVDNFHSFFDKCGVDIVLGHHPHNVQSIEKYNFTDPFTGKDKKGFACYSLGNFIADDIFMPSKISLVLKIHIGKGIINGEKVVNITNIETKPCYSLRREKGCDLDLRILDLDRSYSDIINKNHSFLKHEIDEISWAYHFHKYNFNHHL